MEIPEELYILCELDSRKLRWDFIVTVPSGGQLVCSYYPEDAIENLMLYFWDLNSNIAAFGNATEYAVQLLQKHIKENLEDALVGLIYETRVKTVNDLNGLIFSIDGFDYTKKLTRLRGYYSKALTRRMNAHGGQPKDRIQFLKKAYRAYSLWADANLRLETERDITRVEMADRWGGQKNYEHGKGISVHGLEKQLKRYEMNWRQVIEICKGWRFEEWRRKVREELKVVEDT